MSESERMRIALNRHFVDSGEKEKFVLYDYSLRYLPTNKLETTQSRLMNILRARLIEQGWNDDMDAYCRDIVRARHLENITMDELVKEAADYGRRTVPESTKKELLVQIKKYLDTAFE